MGKIFSALTNSMSKIFHDKRHKQHAKVKSFEAFTRWILPNADKSFAFASANIARNTFVVCFDKTADYESFEVKEISLKPTRFESWHLIPATVSFVWQELRSNVTFCSWSKTVTTQSFLSWFAINKRTVFNVTQANCSFIRLHFSCALFSRSYLCFLISQITLHYLVSLACDWLLTVTVSGERVHKAVNI